MRLTFAVILLLVSAAATAADRPVSLWQIDGNDNRVYVLGSVHLLRERDHPLPAVIDAAYDDAEILVMELDMDDMNPLEAQSLLTRYGVLRDGRTLAELMGADYERAQAAADLLGMPLHLLERTKPWYAAITIEIMALQRIGYDPMLGVELTLSNRAAADNKPIIGLETMEQQIQFLDGLADDVQRQMLLSTLEDAGELEVMMDLMIDAWRGGDMKFFEDSLLTDLAEYPELYDALLKHRNERWIKDIVELLDDDVDYLVVVGTLHLAGEDGVPKLLEKQGAEIHQLSESATLR